MEPSWKTGLWWLHKSAFAVSLYHCDALSGGQQWKWPHYPAANKICLLLKMQIRTHLKHQQLQLLYGFHHWFAFSSIVCYEAGVARLICRCLCGEVANVTHFHNSIIRKCGLAHCLKCVLRFDRGKFSPAPPNLTWNNLWTSTNI